MFCIELTLANKRLTGSKSEALRIGGRSVFSKNGFSVHPADYSMAIRDQGLTQFYLVPCDVSDHDHDPKLYSGSGLYTPLADSSKVIGYQCIDNRFRPRDPASFSTSAVL